MLATIIVVVCDAVFSLSVACFCSTHKKKEAIIHFVVYLLNVSCGFVRLARELMRAVCSCAVVAAKLLFIPCGIVLKNSSQQEMPFSIGAYAHSQPYRRCYRYSNAMLNADSRAYDRSL